MKALEQVERWHEERMKELQRALEEEPLLFETRKRVAKVLDGMEMTPTYTWYGRTFELQFAAVEEARAVVDKLITEFGLEKAEKSFDGWKSEPEWRYEFEILELRIKVSPAEPSADCHPVIKASTSTFWVCERKEG